MDQEDFERLLALFYVFFCVCIIVPPQEAVSAGLTIQNLFDWWCGSEELNFVYYHLRRCTATLAFHSLLPLGYVIALAVADPYRNVFRFWERSDLWIGFSICTFILPAIFALWAFYWSINNWNNHPLATKLGYVATQGSNWRAVASSINVEFRRPSKFSTGLYSRRIYITDTWIVRVSTYTIDVAPLSDVILTLKGSQELRLTHDQPHGAQYLQIGVTCINPRVKAFELRLNAQDYNDLKDRLLAPVRNVNNITIQRSLIDRFLSAFREQVNLNGTYKQPQGYPEPESCIGCMAAPANVKLVKQCATEAEAGECRQCYCRPLWCLDCMGKWFANRQPQDEPSVWLAGRAPCPMCRAQFCATDVCLLEA